MNYIYFILFYVFTITKAIICPSHYMDNLCLIIDDSEEKEIVNNDYCLECTYKYRKCKETDNFDNIYCNPVNGLCELNETEFNTICDFDIDDNKKENIICTNFTYQKKGNNNELKYSLIVICIILFVCCIFMLWYIIYNKYYKNKQDKFIEERVLEEYKTSETNYDNENDNEDKYEEIELDSDDRPKYIDDITESIIKL